LTIVSSNYYRYKIDIIPTDGYIDIPVQITFDNLGRDDGLKQYEENVIEEVINPISDFETTSFAHATWGSASETSINYEFYFYNGGDPSTVTATTDSSSWVVDYEAADFTDSEIYYFANSFKGSFFKLDFYDTKDTANQKIFFSVILPTQQGVMEDGFIGPTVNQTPVKVKRPKYILDYVGADKEGFFIYWLKNQSYVDQTEYYVSAKFFNAKTGQFVRLMNKSQGNILEKFNFNKSRLFYYKCILDYNTYEYKFYKENNLGGLTRVGTTLSPIKWYEYVNP
jgi:hypothetical protein